MLKVFRHKNVTKIVLWGLLILVLPAFVLWGTGAGGDSKNKGPKFVGLIDGRKVTFNDFAESIAAIRCQVILNYFNQPQIMDTILKSNAFVGNLAWNRLIMTREARKAHIKVSNAEVVNFIRTRPIFMRGGQFDDRMYGYILRNNLALEPRTFEEMMRSNLEIQKFNDHLTKDVKAADQEIAEAYGKENDKLKVSYIDFTVDGFADKVKIDELQMRDYYKEHQEEFKSPAKGFDDVKTEIKTLLTRRQARDLAVKTAGEMHGKIKDLMAKENLTFEAAAVKLSLNARESAFFSKGEKIEGVGDAGAVLEVAKALKSGEVSAPVETGKGAMIFRASGREKFDEEKFKKEKGEYSKNVVESKKTQYLENWLKGLENATKVNIDFKDYEKYYR